MRIEAQYLVRGHVIIEGRTNIRVRRVYRSGRYGHGHIIVNNEYRYEPKAEVDVQ